MIKDAAALERPGNADGQQLIVRRGGKVELHTWSAEAATWSYIGIVSGAKDNGSAARVREIHESQ